MKRILYILLLAMGMVTIAPMVSIVDNRVAAAYAADDKAKAKAQAQKEKEKAAAQKEKEKAKAQAQKEKEKAQAQKEKEKAKAAAQKEKDKAKAQAQKEKDKAAAQKEKDKAKAQAQKDKEKAAAQKQRDLAKAQAQKEKAKAQSQKAKTAKGKPAKEEPELSPEEEKKQYYAAVAKVEKNNKRVLAYMNRDISHRLGFWGQVGYSNLFTSGILYNDAAGTANPIGFQNKDKGFVGGGLGLGYQLRYKQFLMTVGAEFNFYNSVMGIGNQQDGTFALDYGMNPYPATMTYHYNFSQLNDRLIGGYAQIPLLFGMELKKIPLFWQVGVKGGLCVMGQSTVKGTMTTSITDDELIIDLTDMYSHYLVTDEKFSRPTTKASLGLNVAATAEIGVNLDQWVKASPKLRVSLFADYGVLNTLNYKADANAQDIPTRMTEVANPLDFPTNSALATTSAANAKVNPFLVGVKFAVWFELPRKQLVVKPGPMKPQPRLGVHTFDLASGADLGGVSVEVTELATDKPKHKNSNRQGLIKMGRVEEGGYRITATKNGYYPSDTVVHNVEEFTYDTVQLALERIPEPIIPTLCMNIYDEETREPIEAAVRLTASTDTIVLYAAQSSDDGFIETPLTAGDYIAHLTSTGYMPKDEAIHFVEDTIDIYMQPIQEGIKVKIENLFFATNKTYILPQSEQAMSDLATFLLENPSVTIHIVGHTDAVGSDEANQILSEGRANAVRADLIKRGVAAERLTTEGKGEKEPVADNDTEEGRQLNRRVEFTITGTDGEDIEQIY